MTVDDNGDTVASPLSSKFFFKIIKLFAILKSIIDEDVFTESNKWL